jgi:hypothetical protein
MRQSFPALRRAAVVAVAIFSVVGALALVWLLGRRELIGSLTNVHLAGMVALFLLPPVTMAAWELDRRMSARRGVAVEESESATVHAHAASGRPPKVKHRRLVAHEPGVRA